MGFGVVARVPRSAREAVERTLRLNAQSLHNLQSLQARGYACFLEWLPIVLLALEKSPHANLISKLSFCARACVDQRAQKLVGQLALLQDGKTEAKASDELFSLRRPQVREVT